jgi:hypothetical protein
MKHQARGETIRTITFIIKMHAGFSELLAVSVILTAL